MGNIRVFTNSVSDLSPELAACHGITLVPDTMVFDGQVYLNNIDIDPPRFFERMKTADKLPTSSHPNIAQYTDSFCTVPEGDEILCVTLTSKMSGSYNTACIAAHDLAENGQGPRVTVYDSLQVSHGLAIMAIEAAKQAKLGKSCAEICAYLDSLQPRIGVYFSMYSLQNAKKGGRVGAIRALAADALGIKPILQFTDGLVRDVAIVRGLPKAREAVYTRFARTVDPSQECFVFHSGNLKEAEALRSRILAEFPGMTVTLAWVGAVIGIYTGEGCLGLAYQRKE